MNRVKTTVAFAFFVVFAVAVSISGLIRPSAQGNLQGSATEQAVATAVPTVSVGDLSVVSVDKLEMLAGPTGTLALLSPNGKHLAYLSTAKKNMCFYTPAGQEEGCIDLSSNGLYNPGTIRWSPDVPGWRLQKTSSCACLIQTSGLRI